MQYYWRITKYNPNHRDSLGRYTKDTWISYSDIGKTYDNTILDIKHYLYIENLYIKSVLLFMDYLNITKLQANNLENWSELIPDEHITDNMITLFKTIKNNDWITKEYIPDTIKLILREQLWSNLSFNNKLCVNFGFDYYMYIGSFLPCTKIIGSIKQLGLFVENCTKPLD